MDYEDLLKLINSNSHRREPTEHRGGVYNSIDPSSHTDEPKLNRPVPSAHGVPTSGLSFAQGSEFPCVLCCSFDRYLS